MMKPWRILSIFPAPNKEYKYPKEVIYPYERGKMWSFGNVPEKKMYTSLSAVRMTV